MLRSGVWSSTLVIFFWKSLVLVLFDGDSFEVGDPGWLDDLTTFGHFLVAVGFGLGFHPSFWLNLSRMISQTMNYWTLWMKIVVALFHLRWLCKLSFGLKMILQLVDDWASWAVVAVVLLSFWCLFKGTFWLKMILKWSNNVCASGRLSLVVGFRFSFGCNWGCSKAEGRWSSEVGTRFTSVAEEFHLGGTVVGFSWRITKGSRSSLIDWSVTSDGSSNGWGGACVWLLLRHCCNTCVYFFLFSQKVGDLSRFVVWKF